MANQTNRVKGFRLGLLRAHSGGMEYKPAAYVGLTAEGSVMVSPYSPVPGWRYGLVGDNADTAEHVEMEKTPKLHYHRSGEASITLTGTRVEKRSLQLTPLPEVQDSQIMSIVTTHPAALPTHRKGAQKRDMFTRVSRWPDAASWGIHVVNATRSQRERLELDELPLQGLLTGATFTHGVVNLSVNDWDVLMVVTTAVRHSTALRKVEHGTTVAALNWNPGGPDPAATNIALWSAQLRNPAIRWEDSSPTRLAPTHPVSLRHQATSCVTHPRDSVIGKVRRLFHRIGDN